MQDAVLEVIDLLCGNVTTVDTDDDDAATTYTGGDFDAVDADGSFSPLLTVAWRMCRILLDRALPSHGHGARNRSAGRSHRALTATSQTRPASSSKTRPSTVVSTTTARNRKREQHTEVFQAAVTELINYFSHRNVDAIVRVIKVTLEKLRRRITSTLSYGETTQACLFASTTDERYSPSRSTSSRSACFQSLRRTAHTECDHSTGHGRSTNLLESSRANDCVRRQDHLAMG